MRADLRPVGLSLTTLHMENRAEDVSKEDDEPLKTIPLCESQQMAGEPAIKLYKVRIPPGRKKSGIDTAPNQGVGRRQEATQVAQPRYHPLCGALIVWVNHAALARPLSFQDV